MRRYVLALAMACGVQALAPAVVARQVGSSVAASPTTESIAGVLEDGTRWQVLTPSNWNGTLLLDLDGAGPAARPGAPARPQPPGPPGGAFTQWLLSKGYAYGGIVREPVGYDFPRAVQLLVDLRDQATARWGLPKRTLAVGGSRGAFVVRKALELRPDVFDGGVMWSGGGAGEVAVLRNKLNALFVLKTLVDPASALGLVNVDLARDMPALTALVDKAKATPAGRARLALAGAVEQFSLWSVPGSPPPAADDYEGQVDQMAQSFVFAAALPVRAGVEKIARGNVSWNTDADYARLLRLSGRQAMVAALYAQAGLSLDDDLRTLARAPRIAADEVAVRRIEPMMTYTGRISDPLVNVDNDDPVDPASDKLVYQDTLRHAGTDRLFRLLWANGAGHGGQTPLDRAVGFQLLIDRLDTGRWADTSLPALQQIAAATRAGSPVDLGNSTLFDPGELPRAPNRWDERNWDSYRAR
ncbi:hypothetical protein SAMN06297144_3400 [Sphingomonas guangdongensis]|uniref:Uncharacterized protein n=1 Tax=Sphingomonas guangdongensis TaxID=1141890 RepID=A0A285R2D3_9SPHN|nr:hypothetical protein [Sphingomonas guangdongensis]SOB88255.1 hypothetical protein SAMN06297144_3400 [Sphingomonas guangdongensis]